MRYASYLLLLTIFATTPVLAQDAAAAKTESSEDGKSAAEKAVVYEVKPEPLRVEVELSGVFEAQEMTPVSLDPQRVTELVVMEAAPQGKEVKKGDLLLQLDTEKIDEQIADLETARSLAQLSLEQAETELAALEQTTPLELEAAERAKRVASEDLQYFLEVDRPLRHKSAEHSLKQAEQRLEYAQEELEQLEKMYKADDLTEETEEIVLKRARNSVESAEFSLERTRTTTQQELEVTLPREEIKRQETARQQAINWEKSREALPAALKQKRLELEKMRYDHEKGARQLKELKADRKLLTVNAPAEGIIYYGQCERGQWRSAAEMLQKLRRGGRITPHEVFITIVKPRPMTLRAAVEEQQLHQLAVGSKGTAIPQANPQLELPVEITKMASIPLASGGFDAQLKVDLQDTPLLMPGMNAKIKLTVYEKEDAITVPTKALHEEQGETFVYLRKGEGEREKQVVEVGQRTDEKVEIVEGVEAGDKVLVE